MPNLHMRHAEPSQACQPDTVTTHVSSASAFVQHALGFTSSQKIQLFHARQTNLTQLAANSRRRQALLQQLQSVPAAVGVHENNQVAQEASALESVLQQLQQCNSAYWIYMYFIPTVCHKVCLCYCNCLSGLHLTSSLRFTMSVHLTMSLRIDHAAIFEPRHGVRYCSHIDAHDS